MIKIKTMVYSKLLCFDSLNQTMQNFYQWNLGFDPSEPLDSVLVWLMFNNLIRFNY